jgi:TRAP transporter 4TM/12TM fusion protein
VNEAPAPPAGALPHAVSGAPELMPEELESRPLRAAARYLFFAGTLIAILLSVYQIFALNLWFGVTLIESQYLYLLAAPLLPLVFLAYPAAARQRARPAPWYDFALAALALALMLYLASQARRSLDSGWETGAPPFAAAAAGVAWLVIMEGLRRTSGWTMTIIVGVVSLYPLAASVLPSPLSGISHSLADTMSRHLFSAESSFGIPMRAFGEIIIGFIVFGVALNYTGGGKFFNDLAFALVGRWRGGAAQVGVISSMLQGSISGSVISNVISSGVVTIPAMKRTGFRADYAGGVEAVASTGAVLMPPVMGSTAFVMASFLGRPYAEIALAAAIPGVLFYLALMVQIDAYAARLDLRGLAREELPRLGQVMRAGWYYIPVFAVLVYFLLEEQREAQAPYFATALLLIVNQFDPRYRMRGRMVGEFILATGRALADLAAILLGIGCIIGAFSMTGLAGTLANDLVYIAGGAPLLLLLMGAITSFVFGMGMTVTACYIFLAIVLAPPLIKAGMDPLAVHLFIMYWGMVSYITPPVALATFAAAPIAKASALSIGVQATRLGTAIYLVPFCFVLNPALILKGSVFSVVVSLVTAIIGLCAAAGALQSYAIGLGRYPATPLGWAARAIVLLGGLYLAAPTERLFGFPFALDVGLGAAILLLGIGLLYIQRHLGRGATTSPTTHGRTS